MAISTGAAILGGGALGLLGSMGSRQENTTSTQTNEPWSGIQPYLLDLFKRGQGVLNEGPSGLLPGAQQNIQSTIRGDFLNPQSNPFLQNYVNDALGQAKSQFAGQYGGAAGQNLGNTGYQEGLARTLGNTALPIYANAYNTERQNQLQASQLAPAFDVQSRFGPLQAYQGLLSGNFGGTSTTQTPYFTNPISGALGGALSGGLLAGML